MKILYLAVLPLLNLKPLKKNYEFGHKLIQFDIDITFSSGQPIKSV